MQEFAPGTGIVDLNVQMLALKIKSPSNAALRVGVSPFETLSSSRALRSRYPDIYPLFVEVLRVLSNFNNESRRKLHACPPGKLSAA